MTANEIESRIRELSHRLSSAVGSHSVSRIEEYLYHTEWEVAFGELWGALSDSGEVLERRDYEALKTVGAAIGVDPESSLPYRNYPVRHR